MDKQRQTGKFGENEAVKYLRSKKYEILTINFHSRFGEIDIIAENKNYIVFVEVKTRNYDNPLANPGEFVGNIKQEKIQKTAGLFLSSYNGDKQPRFDVVEVLTANENDIVKLKSINHLENAWG